MLELIKIKDLYNKDIEYALNRSIFFKYQDESNFYIYSIFENNSLLFPISKETYYSEILKIKENIEFIVKDFNELYDIILTAKYMSNVETMSVGDLLDFKEQIPNYLLNDVISEK